MKGFRNNVRRCKEYVEFQMYVRRWWDEQDEKDRRFNEDEKYRADEKKMQALKEEKRRADEEKRQDEEEEKRQDQTPSHLTCDAPRPEKPEGVTKSWAQEVDEEYPVPTEDLWFCPDTFPQST